MTARPIEHYVPQFLLRNFAIPGTDYVYVYDKREDRVFRANVRNVAAERDFYNVALGNQRLSLEAALGDLEAATARHVTAILSAESLSSLNRESRDTLALFVAVQFVRTRRHVENVIDTMNQLKDRLTSMGASPERIAQLNVPESEEDARQLALSLVTIARDSVPFIRDKIWLLSRSAPHRPLYISDDPIALQNSIPSPFGSNLGIGVPGIEIYLPLSSQLTLEILCPTHRRRIAEIRDNVDRVVAQDLTAAFRLNPPPSWIRQFERAMNTGELVEHVESSWENQNALQVWKAERFVFSSTDDFEIARRMVMAEPRLRRGPRGTIT